MPENQNQENNREEVSEEKISSEHISESEKQWIEDAQSHKQENSAQDSDLEEVLTRDTNVQDETPSSEGEVHSGDDAGDDELTDEEKKLKEEALEEVTKPNLKGIVEALLFVSDEAVSIDRFRQVLGQRTKPQVIRDIIENLKSEYSQDDRGFMIIEVANAYQLATRPQYAHWLNKIQRGKKSRYLSKSSLETLSIISYRQPLIRAEIEAIRGVNVDGVLKTLLERNLIKIVGKKEVPGRPLLFGITKRFLEYFGLKSLDELPKLPDIKPEDEEKILESMRAGAQIDSENQGMREEQPIVEDYQATLDSDDDENILNNS